MDLIVGPTCGLENHDKGNTPLYSASKFANKAAVEALLDIGGDVGAKMIGGLTPLYLTSAQNVKSLPKVLMSSQENREDAKLISRF